MTAGVPAPAGGALTPADKRKRLGKINKELARDPANFGRNIASLVGDGILTDAQSDLCSGMLAFAERQSNWQTKARAYAELGGELSNNIFYYIGRTLTQPVTGDPEAIATRRPSFIAAGEEWYRINEPTL